MPELAIQPGAPRLRMGAGEKPEPSEELLSRGREARMRRINPFLGFSSNTLSSIDFKLDSSYDPYEDDKDLFLGPDALPPGAFTDSRSQQETAFIAHQVRQEQKDLRTIAESGASAWWDVIGVGTNPLMWAGMLVPGSVGLPAVVGTEMALEAGSELMLHRQQRLRTLKESAVNIGMVGVGTAIVGAAVGYAVRRTRPEQEGLREYHTGVSKAYDYQRRADGEIDFTFRDIDEDLLAEMDPGAIDLVHLDEAADVGLTTAPPTAKKPPKPLNQPRAGDFSGERMVGGKVAEKLARGPAARILESSESGEAKVLAQQMADPSLMTKAHEEGLTWGPAAEARGEAATGRAVATIESMKPLQKKSGLTPEEFDIQVGRALSNDDLHPNPHVQQAAKKYRTEVLEPVLKQAQEAGVLKKNLTVRGALSYFPRIYRHDAITEGWDHLKSLLMGMIQREQPDLPLENIEAGALRTLEAMLGDAPLRTMADGKPGALHSRTVDLMDDVLEPYLEKRASAVLMRHIKGMSPYLEMYRHFGKDGYSNAIKRIHDEYLTKIDAAPTQKEKDRLSKQRGKDIKNLDRLHDRVLRRIQNDGLLTDGAIKAIQWAKTGNVLTQLGDIVASSFPDLARPLAQYGVRSYVKGMAYGFKQLGDKSKYSKAAIQRTGVALERTLNQKILDISDQARGTSSTLNTANRLWGKFTGFNLWTDFVETLAAHSSMDFTIRQARRVAKGQSLTRANRGILARMGLNEDDLTRIAAETEGQEGTLLAADTLRWTDPELARTFEAAVGSDVRRTIVRIGVGDRPLNMDNVLMQIIFQYMSFALAATNKMLVAGIQQRDMKFAIGTLAGAFLGSMVGGLKAWTRGEDPTEWSLAEWGAEGVDRSGILGVYRPALSAMQIALGAKPSRYLQRELLSPLGGPSLSTAKRLSSAGAAAIEGDWGKMGENLYYITPYIRSAESWRRAMLKLGE